jgi:hypothetical protein
VSTVRPLPWVLVSVLLALAAAAAIWSVLSAPRLSISTTNRYPIGAVVPHNGLSSRIVLPRHSFIAGQTIPATLVVTNENKRSFDLARYCQMNDNPIVLTNREISAGLQAVSDLMCHPLHVVLHPGLNRIRFTIPTTYPSCAEMPPASADTPLCLSDNQMPPFPPGHYKTGWTGLGLPVPPPVSVTLVASQIAREAAPPELPESCTTNPVTGPVSATPTFSTGYQVLDALPDALAAQYPTVYGGIMVAPATSGESGVEVNSHFIVLETTRDPSLEAEATAAYGPPLTVEFKLSPRSWSCLEDVQASVQRATGALKEAGITMIGDGIRMPNVVVEVTACKSPSRRAAIAWFDRRWGDSVQVTTCAKIPSTL